MIRRINFDGDGITTDCPKSDIGCACSEDCSSCYSFSGFKGFQALCKYDDPNALTAEEVLGKAEMIDCLTTSFPPC